MLKCNLKDPGVDPIFGIQKTIADDKRDTVNLTVGVLIPRKGGKPPILEAVKLCEKKLVEEEITKSYLPIAGDKEYLKHTADLVFDKYNEKNICMFQTVGGTSALSLGFNFLKRLGITDVSVSDPTWANHITILESIGFSLHRYNHGEAINNFDVYTNHLESLQENTAVLLHASCHNPTGLDFSKNHWEIIADICQRKGLIPFFDSAYQGFAENLIDDAYSIRHFYQKGLDMFVAHSFSKSFSLYNERVGAFFLVTHNNEKKDVMNRVLTKMIRVNYSSPSSHGSNIVKGVLKDKKLKYVWMEELLSQQIRIRETRKKLSEGLGPVFEKDVLDQISRGNGFFLQLPLKKDEIDRLKIEFGIYLTNSGRLNVAGITDDKLSYVVDSFCKLRN